MKNNQIIIDDNRQTDGSHYDFGALTSTEYNDITEMIFNTNKKYDKEYQGIGLALDTDAVVYKPRYIFTHYIIQKYKNSVNPYDILAVAIAYSRDGAKSRMNAIDYYINFFKIIDKAKFKGFNSYFSLMYFYTELSELCYNENMLDTAYEYAVNSYKEKGEIESIDILRIGEIFRKSDINKCVAWYNDAIKNPAFKADVDINEKLQDAINKQKKNYVFKPRKKKLVEEYVIEDEKKILAIVDYFINQV